MSAGAPRAALDAVHSARPIVARLSTTRNSEDLAADIIEAWTAVETGLRSLVGGSALTGQMLIRELRQRHFLTLDQANALAEFHAARERSARTDYVPTEGDVNAARDAFLKLEAGLMGDHVAPAPAAGAVPVGGAPNEPIGRRMNFTDAEPHVVPTPVAGRPGWLIPLLGLVGLIVVAGLAWFALSSRSTSGSYDQGVTAYREGRREAAAGAFLKATRDDAKDARPHIYLSRMAREAGNLPTAQSEAETAVRLAPTNGAALREFASALFAQRNYDGARLFYTRALKADANDRLSQGFLGCSLVRLGRIDEGVRWIQRAGAGAWSSCAPVPGATQGTVPGYNQPAYGQPAPAVPNP